jgi:hypothetical protein
MYAYQQLLMDGAKWFVLCPKIQDTLGPLERQPTVLRVFCVVKEDVVVLCSSVQNEQRALEARSW